jgi:hypothetical protein
MMEHQFLKPCKIAVSLSESADIASVGLSESHLRDIAVEIARYLLAAGAHLLYGGDLRRLGFTDLLTEVAARHWLLDPEAGAAFTNYLPWPTYLNLTPGELTTDTDPSERYARFVPLAQNGADEKSWTVQGIPPQGPAWAEGLTAMRQRVTVESYARVVLGGRVEGFSGRMPGVAEETLLSLEAGQPLFLIGGFGGCARRIAADLGMVGHVGDQEWRYSAQFSRFKSTNLNNGLTTDENRRLAATVHSDEVVVLIMRGLRRIVS